MEVKERVIYYTQTRTDAERWAEVFQCEAYYAKAEDKGGKLSQWLLGQFQTIVATSALGYSVDYLFVKSIYFLGLL